MRDHSQPPHSPEPDDAARDALDEGEPSPEELALAQSLANALEGPAARGSGARSPDPASEANAPLGALLETAALVAASRKLELAPDRKASLRAELDRSLEERSVRRDASKPRRWSFWLPFPLAAVALGSLLFTLHRGERAPEAASVSAAPSAASVADAPAVPPATAVATPEGPPSNALPPKALLRAQADALAAAARSRAGESDTRDVEATRERLEHELSAYRSRLIASLDERVGTSLEGATGR